MKKILLSLSLILCSICLYTANLNSGQAYKISSLVSDQMVIMVENSSLKRNANIVIWTETQVNSQRWILNTASDNKYQLENAYTGLILYRNGAAVDGASVYQYDKNDQASGKWDITPVENKEGYFYITQPDRDGNETLYLEIQELEDREPVSLGLKKEGKPAEYQMWKLESVEIHSNVLTEEIRDEIMESWLEKYYNDISSTEAVLANGGFWGDAEMFEAILDAYETTGDPIHEERFRKLYTNFVNRKGNRWVGGANNNDYNDDIAWIVLVSVRAYLMFGDGKFLTNAKVNFDAMYNRATILPFGTLRWKQVCYPNEIAEWGCSTLSTNSCINGPSTVAACYLAIATGDEGYYNKAKKIYGAQRKFLYEPTTGRVYDSFRWSEDKDEPDYNHFNTWASTYNQGTFLGSAVMLYNHYGEAQYKEDAQMIMKFTIEDLCDENQILKVCGNPTGDLAGFKGILMRYVRRFVTDMRQVEYADWMGKNAIQAYNNRNSQGVSYTAWWIKTPENFIDPYCNEQDSRKCDFSNDPFGPSTVVSAAFNAHLDKNLIIKNAFEKIEAEHFDYIKGVHVKNGTDDDTPQLENVKNTFYTGYHNVAFGNNLAKNIEIRLTSTSYSNSTIEVRLDSPKGTLLGTVNVPQGGNEWQTISTEITLVRGMKNIYLVYNGEDNEDLFKVNYFKFTTDSYIYPDVTNNGGKITSSLESDSNLNNLIDGYLDTKYAATIEPGQFWIQYQSPAPVYLKGYSLASTDEEGKDAEGWKLQGSKEGTNWVDLDTQSGQKNIKPYQLNRYDVAIAEAYSYFRLLITETSNASKELQLAEWQLHGACLLVEDITADGGTLSAQYNGSELNTFINLTDKSLTSVYQVTNNTDFWIEYKGNAIYDLLSYSITTSTESSTSDPKDWTVYGSLNGKDWEEIDRKTNQRFLYRNATYVYICQANAGYQYFRLHITENNGGSSTNLTEWQLYGKYYYDRFYNEITTLNGELSSSQETDTNSENLKKLIDKNGNTIYTLDATELSKIPVWIQYKSPVPVKLTAYSITAGDDATKNPRNWTIEGSNDGVEWTAINSRSNISFSLKGERKSYTVTNTNVGEYTFFRLNILRLSDTSAKEVKIAEWELHGTGLYTKDVTSNGGTISASSAGITTREEVGNLITKSTVNKYVTDFTPFNYVNAPASSISIEYVSPEPVKVISYSLTSAGDNEDRDPKAWILEASNDGNMWQVIDTRNDEMFPYRNSTYYYSCNKQANEYTNFRLTITRNYNSQQLQLAEWQLLTTSVTVDINEVIKEVTSIDIYPNPVEDYLNINMPEKGIVQLYDISGQLLQMEQLHEGNSSIYVGNLGKGIYVIRICFDKEIVSKRIIKK